ncbi:MAG: hypothetical protein R3A48_18795 [Polyangiales bacterium]
MPLTHAGAPFATAHTDPQAPQWAAFACGSTQLPPQQTCPAGQARAMLQPRAQRLPTQRLPAGQWSSTRQSTQLRVAVSQRRGAEAVPPSGAPGGGAQSLSVSQPAAQVWVIASQ